MEVNKEITHSDMAFFMHWSIWVMCVASGCFHMDTYTDKCRSEYTVYRKPLAV